MKKKIIVLVLALVMAVTSFALVGCGKEEINNEPPIDKIPTSQAEQNAAAITALTSAGLNMSTVGASAKVKINVGHANTCLVGGNLDFTVNKQKDKPQGMNAELSGKITPYNKPERPLNITLINDALFVDTNLDIVKINNATLKTMISALMSAFNTGSPTLNTDWDMKTLFTTAMGDWQYIAENGVANMAAPFDLSKINSNLNYVVKMIFTLNEISKKDSLYSFKAFRISERYNNDDNELLLIDIDAAFSADTPKTITEPARASEAVVVDDLAAAITNTSAMKYMNFSGGIELTVGNSTERTDYTIELERKTDGGVNLSVESINYVKINDEYVKGNTVNSWFDGEYFYVHADGGKVKITKADTKGIAGYVIMQTVLQFPNWGAVEPIMSKMYAAIPKVTTELLMDTVKDFLISSVDNTMVAESVLDLNVIFGESIKGEAGSASERATFQPLNININTQKVNKLAYLNSLIIPNIEIKNNNTTLLKASLSVSLNAAAPKPENGVMHTAGNLADHIDRSKEADEQQKAFMAAFNAAKIQEIVYSPTTYEASIKKINDVLALKGSPITMYRISAQLTIIQNKIAELTAQHQHSPLL